MPFRKLIYESNSPQEWDILLNPANYHYHNGYIGKRKNIFENPIYDYILPFINNGSTVLDCGCGWGSPANIIHIEKQCEVTCITNSANQIEFINKYYKHLNVLKKDLNKFKPHKKYDTGIFIESFSHVEDKNTDRLLKNLSEKVNNLLFMIHVSRKDPFYFQEWEMYFNTLENFIKKLNRQGFQIIFCKDLKSDYLLPSYTYWNSRLNIIRPANGQLLELQKMSKQVLEYPNMAAESVGLFIIYAFNLNT
tara:strand:+ start:110 stop:859 length:750 start_codon:yes stop_codon:yes gene_type:complete